MYGKDFVDRINSLLLKKGISKIKFYEDLHLYNNACTMWATKNAIPSSETLYKISKYLDVSMEYLFTGESTDIPQSDHELLKSFHALEEKYQELIKTNIQLLSELD